MKFRCVNEMEQLSFDDSEVLGMKLEDGRMTFTFNGATIKAERLFYNCRMLKLRDL